VSPIPILILSDAPTAGTGLARITKELALHIASELPDKFRVATMGYGGISSLALPFHQYGIEGMKDWVCPTLPAIWEDFAGTEKGILLTIWDPGRLLWLGQAEKCGLLQEYPPVREWLTHRPFELWGYFPIDASGPNDQLTFPLWQAILGYDRVLAYGQWGQDVIARSLQEHDSGKDIDHCSHAINTDIFFESNRTLSRQFFFRATGATTMTGKSETIRKDEVLVGIVATNQARKDWGLAIETAAILATQKKLRLWIHTDGLERHWSIPALLIDYGLVEKTVISLNVLSDEKMAEAYSACDITLGIGPEGWGFPLAESLACGTPVIHGDYGGGAEIVPAEMKVKPIGFRMDGLYAQVRPIYSAQDWAARAIEWIGKRATLDPQYDWKNAWPRWEKWLTKGMK
jgi:glycosyltransferase involved in cell wall biosynthesis